MSCACYASGSKIKRNLHGPKQIANSQEKVTNLGGEKTFWTRGQHMAPLFHSSPPSERKKEKKSPASGLAQCVSAVPFQGSEPQLQRFWRGWRDEGAGGAPLCLT